MEHALSAAQDLLPVKALKQHWTQENFSYLHKPRPDYGLMLLVSGCIDFVAGDFTLRAQAGDVIFLPQGCKYEARFRLSLGPIDNYLINFESSSLRIRSDFPCRLLENTPPDCAGYFRQFVEEYHTHACTPLRRQGLMYLMLDAIFHAASRLETRHTTVLDRARTLLTESELSIRDVARQCSVSESSLRALFQSQLHVSPARFRLESRLSHAAFLLESTDMTVSEIADAAHFYDAAYFCRLFRRRFSRTPRQYALSKRL